MVKIVADTTSGLPREMLKLLGIPLIPQIVVFGEESYRDDTELDTAAFLVKLKASKELPKTAAPAPVLYNPIYAEAKQRGESVIVIAPSAKISGTVRAATVAAQDFPGVDVRVVDSLTTAGNLASLVLMADAWAKSGLDADAIVSRLNDWIARGRIYFLVNTLEYLQKGGRIGGAKALMGELLQIKPILCLREGQVEPFEQQRTKKRAVARLVEIVEEQCPKGPEAHLCVMQADAMEEAEVLAADLRSRMNLTSIPIYELPPAIVVHGGPGVLGIGFFVV
ncbi:MAG: DegV family protein [Chloroflexi bacterium]|jgi:DegV family protein with EDD domain|nr:DegV family protein [Chloroflexota bacterium]MBE3119499.1 DegV family protein [Candidatus Atribacteria bacterium]